MGSNEKHLSPSAYDAFCQQVLNGVAFCADSQILALADELQDIIRGRRNERWMNASTTERSFDPASAQASGAEG